ncbi:MAG: hypothetical protein J6Q32_03955 [Clostridia bacterium]|nr:hypothetical protein [Clostridia bacterium]
MKKTFYSEICYIFGIICIALGTALMSKANFGMSMVVAPAFILHAKLSQFLPFLTLGMTGYMLQAVILVIMIIILRKAKITYLFSFLTGVIIGFTLDGFIYLLSFIPNILATRIVCFALGMPIVSLGVAFMFKTYFPPESYDLFVKEVSKKFNLNTSKFKTGYDIVSLIVSVVLSFAFFGLWQFKGVYFGTLVCAILNGLLIGLFTKLIDKFFIVKDKFNIRKYF